MAATGFLGAEVFDERAVDDRFVLAAFLATVFVLAAFLGAAFFAARFLAAVFAGRFFTAFFAGRRDAAFFLPPDALAGEERRFEAARDGATAFFAERLATRFVGAFRPGLDGVDREATSQCRPTEPAGSRVR